MKMTLDVLAGGALLVFASIIAVVVVLPAATLDDAPSDIHRERSPEEETGRNLYVANGCAYCHGADFRGSPLATVKTARTFNADGHTQSYSAGDQVTCYDCHDGPDGGDD